EAKLDPLCPIALFFRCDPTAKTPVRKGHRQRHRRPALAGCGGSQSSLEQHLKQAAAQIRTTPEPRALHTKLERTLAAVRADRPRSAAERRAKRLAIAGVRAWLRGLESQVAFVENDSGNLPVATRDAKRAYHARLVGANLLRRAGDLLGIHIGMLSGF